MFYFSAPSLLDPIHDVLVLPRHGILALSYYFNIKER